MTGMFPPVWKFVHSRCIAPGIRPPRLPPRLLVPSHSASVRTSSNVVLSSLVAASTSLMLAYIDLSGFRGENMVFSVGLYGCLDTFLPSATHF